MCMYCNLGDWAFKRDRPWEPEPMNPQNPRFPYPNYPSIPGPHNPPLGNWDIEKLKEYLEILKEIHALEDKLGCPCTPNKADYLKLFKERIEKLMAEQKPI